MNIRFSPMANGPWLSLLLLSLVISGCGGSGGGGGSSASPVAAMIDPEEPWVDGQFEASENFIYQCQNPRSGINPATSSAYLDSQGTSLDENNWLRAWSHETYLWYDEIIDRDPSLYSTPEYFDLLKTEATTASGNPKDQFHFSIDTTEWFQRSQSGVESGFGIRWGVISAQVPRDIRITYIEPGSPADTAGLTRGLSLSQINNINVINEDSQAGVDTINEALFSPVQGGNYDFNFTDLPNTTSLTAAVLEIDPAPISRTIATGSGNVGYLLFNTHNAIAEERLVASMTQFASDNINDLVLDLRYNTGGFLAIASQLAYMIAGSAATANKVFETTTFNDKHPDVDPVTENPITPFPFIDTTVGFSSLPSGQALPQLNLNRVFILSTEDTCSASESIINGLRGIDIEVILIGSTTCGKPYGFYGTDNCGTTYFTIQFQGQNNKGFGDYADGFSPINTSGSVGTLVNGCSVNDDLSTDLGDNSEDMLAVALNYRDTATCPTPSGSSLKYRTLKQSKLSLDSPEVQRPHRFDEKILHLPNGQ